MATEGFSKDAARELGRGWKVSPFASVKPRTTYTVAQITGPGCIQQIWLVMINDSWRDQILRMYWDDEADPSVEVPAGDFFASGWGSMKRCATFGSLAVCVNPRNGLNCYWRMPFRKSCRITIENRSDNELVLPYQINYVLTPVPADEAYFHAQFRRENPLKNKGIYTILDGVKGQGQYVGTYVAYSPRGTGWWGEGEIKFYLDGDKEFPTICGTGTEDYFCGSFDFELGGVLGGGNPGRYTEFATPYSGLPQVIRPDGLYDSQTRFSLYRWHIADPVRFTLDLKVTIQDLGWHADGRYRLEQDDIASVAFWYQTEPHAPFPQLPSRDDLEVGGP